MPSVEGPTKYSAIQIDHLFVGIDTGWHIAVPGWHEWHDEFLYRTGSKPVYALAKYKPVP